MFLPVLLSLAGPGPEVSFLFFFFFFQQVSRVGHVTVGEFFFPACAACRMSACAISIDKEAKQDFQVTYLCNVVFFYYNKVFLMLALQLTTVKQCFQLKLLAMLVQNSNCQEMAQVKDRLIQKLSF